MNAPQLWVFKLEVRPQPTSPESQQFDGAFVVCWQIPGLAEDPVLHATKFIRDSGWDLVEVEQAPELVGRSEVPQETIDHFDQALVDREVYVFHTWPINPMDATSRQH